MVGLQYLHEIILVDDFSDKKHLGQKLDRFIHKYFPSKVRLISVLGLFSLCHLPFVKYRYVFFLSVAFYSPHPTGVYFFISLCDSKYLQYSCPYSLSRYWSIHNQSICLHLIIFLNTVFQSALTVVFIFLCVLIIGFLSWLFHTLTLTLTFPFAG
jgi:hypothetical protein